MKVLVTGATGFLGKYVVKVNTIAPILVFGT